MRGRFSELMARAPVTFNLILINILVLLLCWLMETSFHTDLTRWLGLYSPVSPLFRPHQYISSMFMHAGFGHLFFNMFALFMFGASLEQYWGSRRFLVYYFLTGLGAAGLHTLVTSVEVWQMQHAASEVLSHFDRQGFLHFVEEYGPRNLYVALSGDAALLQHAGSPQIYEQAAEVMDRILRMRMNVPTVGASGAIYGILLGFGMIFPNAALYIMFIPIPIRAKYAVMGFAALELILGLSMPGSNIAHFAHLGGMLFGFLLILYWRRHGTRL